MAFLFCIVLCVVDVLKTVVVRFGRCAFQYHLRFRHTLGNILEGCEVGTSASVCIDGTHDFALKLVHTKRILVDFSVVTVESMQEQ